MKQASLYLRRNGSLVELYPQLVLRQQVNGPREQNNKGWLALGSTGRKITAITQKLPDAERLTGRNSLSLPKPAPIYSAIPKRSVAKFVIC